MSYKHVLVAIDLSEPSDKLIARAVSLAKNMDAKLSFITVDIIHPDGEMRDYDQAENRIISREHDEMMAKLTELTELVGYPVESKLVVDGDVEDKLLENVEKIGADVLISGHHHGFWSQWWSSAHKLVSKATVDLLLISI
ncbi:universal stress protein [Vibrio sp. JC009]|uniref:universal stress protein n=1 Tax=Vibrio sp. JC009 TaxID=2912314 RepID=UPI0023B10F5D|nr:universal stress protein [Vibrio sp. JC009]WED24079.1 universal stress protein [Vibrio sp. JC009]